jgi:hypothetical protein
LCKFLTNNNPSSEQEQFTLMARRSARNTRNVEIESSSDSVQGSEAPEVQASIVMEEYITPKWKGLKDASVRQWMVEQDKTATCMWKMPLLTGEVFCCTTVQHSNVFSQLLRSRILPKHFPEFYREEPFELRMQYDLSEGKLRDVLRDIIANYGGRHVSPEFTDHVVDRNSLGGRHSPLGAKIYIILRNRVSGRKSAKKKLSRRITM